MSDIANLQEAVETARVAYTRASEQHARSRKHALSLIHIVEQQVRDKRIELSQNDVQRESMTREYGQLRQMLHTLVMTVEVGAAEVSANDPMAIEARPNLVTPPAPVAVAKQPKEPAPEAAWDPKPRRAGPQEGAAKAAASSEVLRAGLKRMLKKKRTPVGERKTIQTEKTKAPTPAE